MHLPNPSRASASLVASFVIASLLAACGASATPTPPPDPSALLARTVAATTKLTGPLDIALTLDGKLAQAGSAATDISGSSLVATIDPAGGQGELTVTLKGVQAADLTADARVVGGTAYLTASPLGATWYSLPLSAAEGLVPSSAPAPSAIPSFDLSTQLAPILANPGLKITSGGVQQLDGRDQDVVLVTVTGATVAALIAQAAQAASLTGAAAVPLPSVPPTMPDIPVTFWIDRQSGQLSKVSTTIADSGSSLTVALTIKAHSGSLSIQVPPADQTQDASQLLQMFMGSGSGVNPFATPAP